jgi:hypothetical protein
LPTRCGGPGISALRCSFAGGELTTAIAEQAQNTDRPPNVSECMNTASAWSQSGNSGTPRRFPEIQQGQQEENEKWPRSKVGAMTFTGP